MLTLGVGVPFCCIRRMLASHLWGELSKIQFPHTTGGAPNLCQFEIWMGKVGHPEPLPVDQQPGPFENFDEPLHPVVFHEDT
jgi:hypothetical protein